MFMSFGRVFFGSVIIIRLLGFVSEVDRLYGVSLNELSTYD